MWPLKLLENGELEKEVIFFLAACGNLTVIHLCFKTVQFSLQLNTTASNFS